MNINSFPSAENSAPAWGVELPPDNVFIAAVSVVDENSYLVKNQEDIQTFIKEELTNAGIKLAESEAQAKMRLDCKVTLNPVHESRVPTESLQPNTQYSSIVVEIQLKQQPDKRLRQPYWDRKSTYEKVSNQNVMSGIKKLIQELLQKLTKK